MSKFRVRWVQTVTEHWYVEVEAKNAKEAEAKWIDGSYLDNESILDASICEFTDFDCVEEIKTKKKGKK